MATTQSKLKTGWKKLPLPARVIIVGGAAYATYKIINSLFGQNVKKAPVDYGQIPAVYQTTGGQSVLWDADPLAKELAAKLEGYNFYTYPETVSKILPLNKDQASLLYNHYNTYYAKDYPTLTTLIANEWGDWSGKYNEAVAHLRSFGLNDGYKNLGKPTNRGLQALRKLGYKI